MLESMKKPVWYQNKGASFPSKTWNDKAKKNVLNTHVHVKTYNKPPFHGKWNKKWTSVVDFTKSRKSKISRKCEFQPIKGLEITLTITLTINLRLTTFCEIDPSRLWERRCYSLVKYLYDNYEKLWIIKNVIKRRCGREMQTMHTIQQWWQ